MTLLYVDPEKATNDGKDIAQKMELLKLAQRLDFLTVRCAMLGGGEAADY